MAVQERQDDGQVRFAQSARGVGGVLVLRDLSDLPGRAGRRRGSGVRHREEGGAVRLVYGQVDRRPVDGTQVRALAQRMFRSGGRQHAETVDVQQGTAERAGAGRAVCQDQAEDPVHRDRPA